MKIIGVAACTVGIAHTYIAQEKLENAAKKARKAANFNRMKAHNSIDVDDKKRFLGET